MISDTCMSGGILDSANELYGISCDIKSLTESPSGTEDRLIADPTSLLDLPPPSRRELGICFTACQSHQTTSGGYNPTAKEYQTSFTQTLMNLAIAYNGSISNFGMAVSAHKEYERSVTNSHQMPGLYGSVDQGNLIFF
ncbi:putative Caspase-like domain-containing protein [Medicago truncatula]|uniref:Putative Caspase-like domain-containing protein n=1 Tax=Medicago truncatula TaxID=3880 RepID=A0A396I2T8_MEDTR|nr:putative Caspase-like domain-containing protein [Medicago truncatula]